MDTPRQESFDKIFWLLVFSIGILFHVAGIGQPFLGNFAQHQTDYATVVQRWLETGIDPFNPVMRFMALGKNRLFYGDFPLNITLVAFVCQWTGWGIEFVGRGLSAVYFFLSLWPFYAVINLIFKNKLTALYSLAFYTFSPLVLIYSQSFLLEMSALSFSIAGYYFFFHWHEKASRKSLLTASILFSFMIATRIYFVFLLIPLLFCFWKKFKSGIFRIPEFYLFFVICFLLPAGWQVFAAAAALGRGDQSSLIDNLRVFVFKDKTRSLNIVNPKILIEPLFDTFVNKALTPIGTGLCVLAVIFRAKEFRSKIYFLLFLLVTLFFPMLVAPRKFIEFEYYYLPFVPPLAILAGCSVSICQKHLSFRRWGSAGLIIISIIFSMRYAAAPILVIPDEDRYVLTSAQTVKEIIPKESRLVASHGNSTSFLYYTDHDGWAFSLLDSGLDVVRNFSDFEGDTIDRIERYRQQGGEYFALADKRALTKNPRFFDYLKSNYEIFHEDQSTLIFDLRRNL